VNIYDSVSGMGILKNISVATAVSIEGIEDPLYPIKNYANISVIIRKSPYNKIANPITDLNNLTSDIKNSYYHSSVNGSSFLDRLEGKFVLSQKYQPYGLESFIYLPNLTSGFESSTLSDLDYQYWTNVHGYLLNSSSQSYSGYDANVYSWFRISNQNDDYGIISLLNMTT
jgi:hypothetical protein